MRHSPTAKKLQFVPFCCRTCVQCQIWLAPLGKDTISVWEQLESKSSPRKEKLKYSVLWTYWPIIERLVTFLVVFVTKRNKALSQKNTLVLCDKCEWVLCKTHFKSTVQYYVLCIIQCIHLISIIKRIYRPHSIIYFLFFQKKKHNQASPQYCQLISYQFRHTSHTARICYYSAQSNCPPPPFHTHTCIDFWLYRYIETWRHFCKRRHNYSMNF